MFRKAWSFIRGWFKPVYRVACVTEKPERVERRTVYMIGEDDSFWAAVLVCPCGCQSEVWLNLLKHENRPTWTVERVQGTKAHITPSVWRQNGCRSHFLIKRGLLIWFGSAS